MTGRTGEYEVVVVGAGFGGLTMAWELKQAGVHNFLVLEEGSEVGGVWRENTYPGCSCDVPAHLYSLAFDPYRDPRVRYPEGQAILSYLCEVTDRHGLRSHLRCGTSVVGADYGDEDRVWTLTTAAGERIRTRAVVWAVGQLHRPALPRMRGVDTFGGRMFHSARWDHTADTTGRVAVVGTGSSAAQLIPELARTASAVTVYQRSPSWVLPKPAASFGPVSRWALTHVPGLHDLYRGGLHRAADAVLAPTSQAGWSAKPLEYVARKHLRRQVRNPELRRKLTPDHRIGEKRILIDSKYYRALTEPNVELVTDGIEQVVSTGIRTVDGTERAADVIVWATGFRARQFLDGVRVRGRGGVDLHDTWRSQGRPTAFYGLAVPGFPNLYLIAGPHSFTPTNSNPAVKQHQVRYIMRCLTLGARLREPIEVTEKAMVSYLDHLDEALDRTIWPWGTASTWWKNADGTVTNAWPETVAAFGKALAGNDPSLSFAVPDSPERRTGVRRSRPQDEPCRTG
ncbi:flavin-containing monooxygenase [Nocardia caishijiensis]|uniref:Cation diffusion facilitator CzcD-associated flavoprotein CzcO n=1 Tax=Nocardia caishijiensis TaxID=184756 RepID=A0ABQ6YH69_9NOCA|nr:NAD(P)/FAD-dependent oxidoreductase [Nocardia caishijiensis]KAF0844849.1 cation diffusion facilitator CzcD-associated flavoprotein CzcO [Nocardia caishijiensis]